MEEINIIHLFEKIRDAWNENNGGLYASYFTENCDYITFDGQHLKGRNENADFHNKLFNGFLKSSKLYGQIDEILFLTPDIAIVRQTGCVKLRFQSRMPKSRTSINTNILVKREGVWKITLFHNCRIKKRGIVSKIINSIFTT